MLQELAARTGTSTWAVVSMLFFLGVWLLVTVRVLGTRREVLDALSRLPLEDEAATPGDPAAGTLPRG